MRYLLPSIKTILVPPTPMLVVGRLISSVWGSVYLSEMTHFNTFLKCQPPAPPPPPPP